MEPIAGPPPWAGTLDEFEDLVEALVVSRKAFLYAFFGWVALQGFSFTYFRLDVYLAIVGQVVCIVYVSCLSIWAGRVYAQAVGRNLALTSFVCGFGSIVPFMVPFGFVAMQIDLIKRLGAFGLRAGKWRLDSSELEWIMDGLENFAPPPTPPERHP